MVALIGALATGSCSSDSSPTTTTPASTSPVTETFTGLVFPNGTISRVFSMTASGGITITLVSAGPPSTILMRIGVGVPFPGSSTSLGALGCSLVQVVDTPPGASAQLAVNADAGNYCVAILDVGNAPKTGVNFLINVVHP